MGSFHTFLSYYLTNMSVFIVLPTPSILVFKTFFFFIQQDMEALEAQRKEKEAAAAAAPPPSTTAAPVPSYAPDYAAGLIAPATPVCRFIILLILSETVKTQYLVTFYTT